MEKGLLIHHWGTWNGNIMCSKSGELFSANKLRALTEETVVMFESLNVKKGDIVALSLKNTVAFPICLMALLYIGANPLLLSSNIVGAELLRLLNTYSFKWIVRDSDLAPLQGLDGIYLRNVLTDKLQVCKNRYAIFQIVADDYLVLPQNGVIIHQTSGTYGGAMLCIRNQEVAIAEAVNYISSIPMYNKIKIRITTPLNHAFSYGFGLMSAIITDSTLIMDESFNPKKIIKEETVDTSDVLCIVPPMMRSFMQLKKRNTKYKLPNKVFYAGSGADAQMAEDFTKTFGNGLFTILGSTETGAIASNYGCTESHCGVGKPLKNVEVDIINKEENYKGILVGDLKVKSTSMMQGYCSYSDYGNIDWFGTGDIATCDTNGNFHIIGRKRDIINVAGIKIDPYEIENVIMSYPGVDDCVVYSGVSLNGEEAIFVCISASSQISTVELMHYCNGRLNQQKCPNRIIYLDKIPRTESGKCIKTLLPNYFHNPNVVGLKET